MTLYQAYINYIKELNLNDLSNSNFKSNPIYNAMLEHVTYELGEEYLSLILTEFSNITYENIIDFCHINDKYGGTNKVTYFYNDNKQRTWPKKNIHCSPSSLRYIYHALIIIDHYKNTLCENIVEIGCGYGGLCLAINFFAKLNNIYIKDYNIVDIKEVCNLIEKYLDINRSHVHTNIIYHTSDTYGQNIINNNLFLISNYCYTEIDQYDNKKYTDILLAKSIHGFFVWQNGGANGAYPIEQAEQITGKKIMNVIEEKPQTDTDTGIHKNYFVYY
jgi:hypothetical protein